MSETITNSWLVEAKASFACGNSLDVTLLKSLEIAFLYEGLVCQNPDIIPQPSDNPSIETSWLLVDFYNRIACGTLLSDLEYHWALVEVARLQTLIYCE